MCETIRIALQKQRDEEEIGTLHVWFNVYRFHWGKSAVYEKSEGERVRWDLVTEKNIKKRKHHDMDCFAHSVDHEWLMLMWLMLVEQTAEIYVGKHCVGYILSNAFKV